MKTIAAFALFASVAFALAACDNGAKPAPAAAAASSSATPAATAPGSAAPKTGSGW